MKTTTRWLCPRCDIILEALTHEQIERLRYDHVKVEHPDDLHHVEGQLVAPVDLIDAHLHYGDEDVAWVVCRLCGEREEISVSPIIYPTYEEAEAAVEAMAEMFSRTHVDRHREALMATAPEPPENPFEEEPERYSSRRRAAQAQREIDYLRSKGEHHARPHHFEA